MREMNSIFHEEEHKEVKEPKEGKKPEYKNLPAQKMKLFMNKDKEIEKIYEVGEALLVAGARQVQ